MTDNELVDSILGISGVSLVAKEYQQAVNLVERYRIPVVQASFAAGYSARDKLSCANCGDGGKEVTSELT